MGRNELDTAFSELDGQEDGDAGPDDGTGHNAHDVPFRDVIGSVTDVQAVLVVADHGARHGNGGPKHRGPHQPEKNGIFGVELKQVLRIEEHTEEHQENDERRS